ncbi:MAG: glycine cleavage system protein H [Deltaproteobacteria bacterium]|nr:glycine cleavage system protein H [Deltaproteobacteria bacterium]
METTYVDLFATKGIEYLLVLGFLPVLAIFWRMLNASQYAAPVLAMAEATAGAVSPWFRIHEGIFYHQGHSWAEPEGIDVVRVGIDDFAQKLLGKASVVELPEVGARVEQGDRGLRVGIGGKSVEILSPVDGEIVERNEEVLRRPELINADPYGSGWLMKVRVPKMEANLRNLLSGTLASAWMEETVDGLRTRLAGEMGMLLQDGGVPVAGMARNLSPEGWDEIAKDFLLTR